MVFIAEGNNVNIHALKWTKIKSYHVDYIVLIFLL